MKPTYLTKLSLKSVESERTTKPVGFSLSAISSAFKSPGFSGASTQRITRPPFRAMRDEFLGAESRGSYIAEAVLFTILVVLSAWPIVLMGEAIARWIR